MSRFAGSLHTIPPPSSCARARAGEGQPANRVTPLSAAPDRAACLNADASAVQLELPLAGRGATLELAASGSETSDPLPLAGQPADAVSSHPRRPRAATRPATAAHAPELPLADAMRLADVPLATVLDAIAALRRRHELTATDALALAVDHASRSATPHCTP